MTRAHLRWVAVGLVLLPVVFGLAVFRVSASAESAMLESDRAFDRGELESSLRYARRAATAYAPGAAHLEAAYARLRAIALGAERARDPALARLAWRAMRMAALETRHLWVSRRAELDEANRNLARLGVGTAEALNVDGRVTDSHRIHRSGVGPARALAAGAALAGLCVSLAAVVWLGRRQLTRALGSGAGSDPGARQPRAGGVRAPALLIATGLIVLGSAVWLA